MDKKAAINIIENTFNASFDESRFMLFAKNLLNDIEPKNNSYSGQYIWDDFKKHINTYKRIGKYIDPEGDTLDVLIVEVKTVKKLEQARTALRNFVIKHLGRFEKDYALVAFYSKEDKGADWRFSFIKLEHQAYLDEVKQKVKTRKEFTPAKRYSFLVGKYEDAHTAKKQLLPLLQNINNNPTIQELEDAFSIEKVTDEFFTQYKDLYVKLYEHFEKDNRVKTELEKAGIDNSRFTKKLLGQIVFLYFLQKKGWLGVPKNEHWGKGDKRFIQNLYEKAQAEDKNYFKDYLQPLFYEALAKERNNDNSYYKRFDCRIPFLNGGLFEAEYDWQNANITIPEDLFRNSEKNKAGDKGTGVLDVFDRYNFTIKEDEPLDKEVAVDPEMLGKVFENMLEITERKSKGAFYTPREIVHYMCQESLIHYLDNALEGKVKKADIETFIRKGHFALENDQRVADKGKETKDYKYQIPESIRQNADLIDQKLSEIKILDPAIGSGAFPVGLLHELVTAHLVIKPHLSDDYFSGKLKSFGFEPDEEISESRYVYRLKRHIIQESIYGVDIDASAIDIARLRLWLSLVVDEDDLDPIETLPNLDYKIVKGNSLIGLPETAMRNLEIEKELENLKKQFYDETNEAKKKELRTQINTKIRELLDSAEQFTGYKIDFDFKLYFSEVWHQKGGFDVVIGNPPYVDYRKIDTIITKKIEFKNTGKKRPNLYIFFIDKGNSLLNRKGNITFINPNQFLSIDSGLKIREYLLKHRDIKFIKDVSYVPVFQNASTYTCIWLASALKKEDAIGISRFDNLNALYSIQFFTNQKEILKSKDFLIPISPENPIIKKLDRIYNKLAYVSELFWGTSASGYGKKKISHEQFNSLDEEEKRKYIPIVQTSDIKNFRIEWNGEYLPKNVFSDKVLKKFVLDKVVVGRLTKRLQSCIDFKKYGVGKACVIANIEFDIYVLVAILNSSVINYWYFKKFESTHMAGGYIRFDKPYLAQIPIPDIKTNEQKITFKTVVDYIVTLKKIKKKTESQFFEAVIDAMVYELYFEQELKQANKEILKHLGDLKPIDDKMSDEEKLAIIQSEFERLYDPNHPVRFALETLDSIEEVRIIKESLHH